MYKKFASLQFGHKIGYAYDSTLYDSRGSIFLDPRFRVFETYGDGLIQHSGDWAVGEEYAIDFLESLLVVLLEDQELAEDLCYKFNSKPSDDALKFAASLVFNPAKDKEWGKKRYFSSQLQKVARKRELEFDTRYRELHEVHDGSPRSIYYILISEYADGFTRWQYANRIREWWNEGSRGSWMEPAAEFLKWFGEDSEKARDFHNAFDACHNVIESVRLRASAENHLKNHRQWLESQAKQLANKEAGVV